MLRRVHAVVGIVSSINLVVLLLSGMLIQHRETLRLEDRVVSRTFLPGSYRADDGPEGVRADIVVTDLHSGRLFGPIGLIVLDLITILWAILLLSGIFMFTSKQLRLRVAADEVKIKPATDHLPDKQFPAPD